MVRARILLVRCFVAVMLAGCGLPAVAEMTTLFVIGDTGDCDTDGAGKVSAAIRAQPDWRRGWLVETGDLAYPTATRERLAECHEPHFDMFPKRLAVPGNHDWRDAEGRGFFHFFPDPVPRVAALGGRWQLWLLNSNLRGEAWQGQLAWLDDVVKGAAGSCVIAAWHHPRWSSGRHGDMEFTAPLWQRVAGVASFTLHGHDHHYEAVPPLDGRGDRVSRGTRSFVAGHGGARLYPPGSAVRPSKAVFGQWGFLRIDIDGDRYAWKALGIDGETMDAGSAACAPPVQ